MMERKKLLYSSMVTMGVKLCPKSMIRYLHGARQHPEVAESGAKQEQRHRGQP